MNAVHVAHDIPGRLRLRLPAGAPAEGLQAAVSAVPGVRAAGLTSVLPFMGGPATDFVIEGRAPVPDSQTPIADIRIVDADYFRTLSIPLRAGRTFTERDTADAPRVMLINEEMARRHWPGDSVPRSLAIRGAGTGPGAGALTHASHATGAPLR